MNRIIRIGFALLILTLCVQAFGNSIEFDWTITNNPHPGSPTAFFQYSGGTVANGVFTPTGLINDTWGPITALEIADGEFATDTPYGPSFQIDGTIEPLSTEIIDPTGYSPITFQGQTENITFYDENPPGVFNFTGVWTVTGLDVPDTTNSALLLATALGALGVFHALGRRRFSEA